VVIVSAAAVAIGRFLTRSRFFTAEEFALPVAAANTINGKAATFRNSILFLTWR